VVPCYGGHADVAALLGDLAALDLAGIELTVTLADNASEVPIATVPVPPGLAVDVVRLGVNGGGSAGFNAAMREVIEGRGTHEERPAPDFLLLLDSDVRVASGALGVLVDVLSSEPGLVGVGAELRDPQSGATYEIGANICPETAASIPAAGADVEPPQLVRCHYVAACCALVRREAVERTGLMPELFLYFDDIDWCLALSRESGLAFAGVPGAIAYHPWWWRRLVSAKRYFLARNAFGPMERLGMSGAQRFDRAVREVGQAVGLASLGQTGPAVDTIRGLADAAGGKARGRGRWRPAKGRGAQPIGELGVALREALGRGERIFIHPSFGEAWVGFDPVREQVLAAGLDPGNYRIWHGGSIASLVVASLAGAARRVFVGGTADVAVVPLGWATGWMHAPRTIAVAGMEFIDVKPRLWRTLPVAAWIGASGLVHALRLRRRGPGVNPLPAVSPRRSGAGMPA